MCPHDDADGCACRKPRPGMLLDAAARWDLDLAASVMVGDRWRDVEAGEQAGVRTIFVDHGYAEELPSAPDHVVADLAEAADLLLRRRAEGHAAGRRLGVALVGVLRLCERQPRAGVPARAHLRDHRARRVSRSASSTSGADRATSSRRFRDRWPAAELAGSRAQRRGHPAGARRRCRRRGSSRSTCSTATAVPAEMEGWADVAVCSEVLEHVDDPVATLAHRDPLHRAGRAPRRHGSGRAPHGVRPLHRSSPALPARGAAFGPDAGGPRGRAGQRHRLPVLQPLQARRAAARQGTGAGRREHGRAVAAGRRGDAGLRRPADPGLNSSRFGWQLAAPAPAPTLDLGANMPGPLRHERESRTACGSRSSRTARTSRR